MAVRAIVASSDGMGRILTRCALKASRHETLRAGAMDSRRVYAQSVGLDGNRYLTWLLILHELRKDPCTLQSTAGDGNAGF